MLLVFLQLVYGLSKLFYNYCLVPFIRRFGKLRSFEKSPQRFLFCVFHCHSQFPCWNCFISNKVQFSNLDPFVFSNIYNEYFRIIHQCIDASFYLHINRVIAFFSEISFNLTFCCKNQSKREVQDIKEQIEATATWYACRCRKVRGCRRRNVRPCAGSGGRKNVIKQDWQMRRSY